MKNAKRLLFVVVVALTGLPQAATIVWVSDDYSANFDQPWINLLTSQGYTVLTAADGATTYWRTLDEAKIAVLNAADLVIVSRKTSSGEYASSSTEVAQWNGLTAPVMCMSAYLTRNVRWKWLDGLQSEADAMMQAAVASDEIFRGVPLDGSNQVDVINSGVASTVITAAAGSGTVLATRATDQSVWIARWDAGAEFYPGSGTVAGGPRMFCGLGQDVSGAAYNITEAGRTIFLNAVQSLCFRKGIVGSVAETGGSTEVWEKPAISDTFSVVLNKLPLAAVDVTVQPVSNAADIQIDGSAGPGEPIVLTFTPASWDVPQTVAVRAVPDELEEGTEYAAIEFRIHSTDPDFNDGLIFPVQITVFDSPINDCPTADLNHDCRVDIGDLALLAAAWLGDPASPANLYPDSIIDLKDLSLFSQNWLDQEGPVVISEFMASNGVTISDGDNQSSDWIELYNMTDAAVNLEGWYLTDDAARLTKWRFPAGSVIQPYSYFLVFASGKNDLLYPYIDSSGFLHTNFNLNASGGYLALTGPDGQTVVHAYPSYPAQEKDISYGLYRLQNRYFVQPTPLSANSAVYEGLVADTKFSRNRGFYTAPFEVSISCATPGAAIHYTTDGSTPNESSPAYTGPIAISATTCLRAAAFKPGWRPSNTDTQTYLFIQDVISQTAPPGYPAVWNGYPADYEMDPDICTNPAYADLIDDALLSLPTVSLVTDKKNLFDPATGLYLNTTMEGDLWERPVSMEFVDPSGTEKSFQEDCGLRIQGGASRNPNNSPKHSLRLLFKSAYGASKLNYPFFGDDAVDSFDTLVLRADYNNSWIHWDPQQRLRGQYLRDQFARDTQLAMGRMSAHGRFVHLYINGLYWGLYNATERPEASFAASYYGGEKEEWDAFNAGVVVDGDDAAWKQALSIASAGVSDAAGYAALSEYVDIPNLIDYMLVNFYGGNQDWGAANWYAAGRKTGTERFKFFCWDAERTLEDPVAHNVTGVNAANSPAYFYAQLRANPEFRMQFADQAHRHLFNGGLLTPSACIARWMERAGQINTAVIAESARWGDYRRDVHVRGEAFLYTRNDHWIAEQNRLTGSYFPVRTNTLIQQLRNAGLYPAVDAPTFNINGTYQHGGYVGNPSALTMDVTGTTSYVSTELVSEGAAVRVYMPADNSLGLTWTGQSFSPGADWTDGSTGTGVGYDLSTPYDALIQTDVQSLMYQKQPSVYCRIAFEVSNPSVVSSLKLQIKYDDGFIAYLNGQEVCRSSNISYEIPPTAAAASHTASAFEEFDITSAVGQLTAGTNILAIHGINSSRTSSDLLILPKLIASVGSTVIPPIWYTTDGTDPRQSGGAVSPSASLYSGAVTLTESCCVKARALTNGTWSALNEAAYAVGPVAESLRITELMYHPADPNCEYIEFRNIGSQTINVARVQMTRGVTFTFPSLSLAPGEYAVVVQNLAAFAGRYNTAGMTIAGQYAGSLENAGEKIKLVDAAGQVIHLFDYSDDWYKFTDGYGFSLTIKDETNPDLALWDQKAGWRPSAVSGGSPGTGDAGIVPPLGAIVINELLAHSHAAEPDWIELHNTTAHDINIGGWFLSDSDADDLTIRKYEIALDTVIPGNGYLVFYQDQTFGNTTDPGCHIPFALSEGGETVYLHSGLGGVLTGYVEKESFGASESGVAFGRYYKASTDSYNFVAMSVNTPGQGNAYPKVGPIVISEMMYNPPAGGSFDHDDYEYIELRNIEDETITLEEHDVLLDIDVPWKFTNGIDYTFPLGVSIAPGGSIVVVKNPAAFSERYPDVPAGVIYGPYSGKLDNGGEKLELAMPGDEEAAVRYYICVDRVNYSDGSAPGDLWPVAADGQGGSLHRKNDQLYGNDVANWQAALPSPGN
ncbi:MAG TPA: lamin tail domain-containing protein [Anaerohalosphaeraceae bacterium]|nr:lamin tail domain-containing protein [Anaerohalosphaeraceae bacterium]HOM75841.1 lamin tail domain-containing protein [Anaerohalosphaeraceae bacterium]HPC65164.1 lamin tail domain-containing protein [Anaerohalosphaeraceae bacterium]HPO68759.1 lamin tail domain-containing protein [Anaerohalosphaeraceae bacterium]HRS72197.1 lamin tail domain-containing protein [Anaerohalosphaeraceae bacterium]